MKNIPMNRGVKNIFTLIFFCFIVSCKKDDYNEFFVKNEFKLSPLRYSTNLTPFDSAVELYFNDSLWLFGGWQPERSNSIYNSFNGLKWKMINRPPWEERNLAGGVVFDKKIFILGGISKNGPLNDVFSSDDGRNWKQLSISSPWEKRAAFGLVNFKGKIFLFGGMGINGKHFNDVWTTSDGLNWNKILDNAPWDTRAAFASIVFEGEIYIIGGGIYNENYVWNIEKNFSDVWKSSDGKNWEKITSNTPFIPRRFFSATVYKNELFIFFGYSLDNRIFSNSHHGVLKASLSSDSLMFYSSEKSRLYGNLNEIWSSIDGINWIQRFIDNNIPIRHEASIINDGNKVYIIGGFGEKLYNDVWLLQ